MLALNDTKLFDECCGWLATWFTTPRLNATASSKNPRNCPIDIFTVRDEARGSLNRSLARRISHDMSKLSCGALRRMSQLYFPEVARHRGPSKAIIGRVLRAIGSDIAQAEAADIVERDLRGSRLLAFVCRALTFRLARTPWAEILRHMTLPRLKVVVEELGLRCPKTHNKSDLVAKILTATSNDPVTLRRLLIVPEMSPEGLIEASIAVGKASDCHPMVHSEIVANG